MILKSVLNPACIALNCSHGTDFVFVTYLILMYFLEAGVARFVLIEKLGSSKLIILGLKQSYLRERVNSSFLKASILCI